MMDWKVVIKNLYTLPLVFGKFPPFFKKNSELNFASYNNIIDVTKSAANAIIGVNDSLVKPSPSHPEERTIVFFLNGICTDKRVWEINAKEIHQTFNFKEVLPLHNPTRGVVPDLIECVCGRNFDIEDHDTRELYKTLRNALIGAKKVIVFAHSQGGIIISQLVEHLYDENNVNMHKLEVYTFASAADEMVGGEHYSEHFANNYDYVARIGVISYKHDYAGNVYERKNGCGHLLNIHYLKPFAAGDFCGYKSKLSQYLRK